MAEKSLEQRRRDYVNRKIREGSDKTRQELRREFDSLNIRELPDDQLIARIKETYPAYSFLLDGDAGGFGEDVKNLFITAVLNDFTPEQFDAKKRETAYFKETASVSEAFDKQRPKDQEDQVAEYEATIRENYGTLVGDEAQFRTIARNAARLGLDGVRLRNFVYASAYQTDGGAQMAAVSDQATKLNDLAGKYLLKSVPQTVQRQVLTGERSLQDVENVLRVQSKTLYPHLADLIDQGLSLEDISAPYRRVIAQELEMDEDMVNMADPKYSRFLDPNQSGTRYAPGEIRQIVRTDPAFGWEYTSEAQDRAQVAAFSIVRAFGGRK